VHQDFADWLRVVSIEPQADELQKWWQAVEAFSKASSAGDLAELARLFYGLPLRDARFLGRFRAAFKATDDAFRMKDNDAEIRVLAGATLVNHFRDDQDEWGPAAALALVCANCQGLRAAPVGEIVTLAEEKLAGDSASLRGAMRETPIPALDLSEELRALKGAFSHNTVTNLTEPLMNVIQAVCEAVGRLNAWAVEAEKQQALRAEESQVLWWLFGGHSRDPVSAFSELKPPSACIVGARDLADLTSRIPGPFAAESFLASVIKLAHAKLDGKASIADAIGACPTDYLTRFLSGLDVASLGDLCPVHQAARTYLDSEGKKGWLTIFSNAVGFKASEKIVPLDLAVQTYRERLVFRVLRDLEEHNGG
jgi:hypothetical protein